jgi:hypothetical protein
MPPLGRLAACGLLLALGAAGCGDVDAGNTPFVGTVLYNEPSGQYSMRMLVPPWTPVPLSIAGMSVFIVLDSTAVPADPAGLLAQALYSLQVQRQDGAPQMQSNSQTDIKTASGATGVETSWQESTNVFHRDAFLAGPSTPTFLLHFTATHAIGDDGMVTQMIYSFDPK